MKCIIYTIFLVLILNLLSTEVKADETAFDNAKVFYEKYGGGNIIFHEGAFYYASRGKAGSQTGIRYGVEGQEIRLLLADGRSYQAAVALESDDHAGSCKRISYIKDGVFYISLYRLEYDSLYSKFTARYKAIDFDSLMYNQKIRVEIDFYLSLVKDGSPQGRVIEEADGNVSLEGVLYSDLSGILSAASWSDTTKKSLPGYFGIELEIFQPSSYSIEYLYQNGEEKQNYRQEFVYGKRERLTPCRFQEAFKAHLYPGIPEKEEILLEQESHFLGWAYQENGEIVFSQEEEIYNLTQVNGEVIRLYAVFQRKSPTIPLLQDPSYEILGWSREKRPVYMAGSTPDNMEELYFCGDSLLLSSDLNLYAVLQEKQRRIRYKTPDQGKRPFKTYLYGGEDIRLIRSKIRLLGFPSRILTRQLAYGMSF